MNIIQWNINTNGHVKTSFQKAGKQQYQEKCTDGFEHHDKTRQKHMQFLRYQSREHFSIEYDEKLQVPKTSERKKKSSKDDSSIPTNQADAIRGTSILFGESN